MLRPERISIVQPAQSIAASKSAVVAGNVASVSFVGSTTTLAVALQDGAILKVKSTSAPEQSRYRIGDQVELRWDPEDLVVLHGDS